MTLPGETICSGAPVVCPKCKTKATFMLRKTPAGYYVGSLCACGPYTRETFYFDTSVMALAIMHLISNSIDDGVPLQQLRESLSCIR